MRPPPPARVLADLLNDARLSEAQIVERVAHALDPNYWRTLADLHVCAAVDIQQNELQDAETVAHAESLTQALHDAPRDGIFALRRVLSPAALTRLNRALDAVIAAGWPPAFVFIYDEFWQVVRLSPILQVVTATLGEGCAQIPKVWVHIVRPVSGASGWVPHVDGVPRGRMSAWFALTDAPLASGCMHVLPRSAMPRAFIEGRASFTRAEFNAALHGVRALPAAAGDVLGWTFDIVHWGGPASPGASERRAISFEFISRVEQPGESDVAVQLDRLPTFEERLSAVANGVLRYGRFEALMIRFEGLARRLLERL